MTHPRDHIGEGYQAEDFSPLSIVLVSTVMIVAALISISLLV